MTAVDTNTVPLELLPAQNPTVQHLKVRTGDLPANAYDLVPGRALLHQIAQYAPAVLPQMAAAGKPGGLRRRRPTCKVSVATIAGAGFQAVFAAVRDRVVGSGLLDAATFDAAAGLLDDPAYGAQCWVMTAVWARKPVA